MSRIQLVKINKKEAFESNMSVFCLHEIRVVLESLLSKQKKKKTVSLSRTATLYFVTYSVYSN